MLTQTWVRLAWQGTFEHAVPVEQRRSVGRVEGLGELKFGRPSVCLSVEVPRVFPAP